MILTPEESVEWSIEQVIHWLEGFIGIHLEKAEKRGKDSLTPSHNAKDGKASALPIASLAIPIAIEPPHVVDEA